MVVNDGGGSLGKDAPRSNRVMSGDSLPADVRLSSASDSDSTTSTSDSESCAEELAERTRGTGKLPELNGRGAAFQSFRPRGARLSSEAYARPTRFVAVTAGIPRQSIESDAGISHGARAGKLGLARPVMDQEFGGCAVANADDDARGISYGAQRA